MKLQKRRSSDQYSEKEGRTITNVAAEFGINKSVVSRAWKAFQTTGTAVRKVGGGRPSTTTAGDDQFIILQVKRGRRQSASVIAQQLSTATGRQVSQVTVTRRFQKGGLFARRPERGLPLKVDHRSHRLQWCREHKNWTTDQWSRVLFTDESRFSTRSDSHRVSIWRSGHGFIPVTSRKDTITVVLEFLSGRHYFERVK
ncbi:transposable element Tcb2 transposase [Trichonephila clavipes]|nr:transposable element Tcb2 transposase [Trichonephila clavipes]